MKLEEVLKKSEELKLKAIKFYCEANQNMFGNINVKKLMKYIERLYSR